MVPDTAYTKVDESVLHRNLRGDRYFQAPCGYSLQFVKTRWPGFAQPRRIQRLALCDLTRQAMSTVFGMPPLRYRYFYRYRVVPAIGRAIIREIGHHIEAPIAAKPRTGRPQRASSAFQYHSVLICVSPSWRAPGNISIVPVALRCGTIDHADKDCIHRLVQAVCT